MDYEATLEQLRDTPLEAAAATRDKLVTERGRIDSQIIMLHVLLLSTGALKPSDLSVPEFDEILSLTLGASRPSPARRGDAASRRRP